MPVPCLLAERKGYRANLLVTIIVHWCSDFSQFCATRHDFSVIVFDLEVCKKRKSSSNKNIKKSIML